LAEVEVEELAKELLDIGPSASELPAVPSAEPAQPARAKPARKEEVDDDMAELAAWAS